MYYSNGWGGIEVVSIDENFNKTLIEKGGLLLLYHSHLALDLKNKHLFYSARHIIWRMDLDGSNRMQFVYSNVSYPNGLVVLHQGRKLCWLDHGRRELSCIGLDQRNRRVVYDNIQASPSCMTALNEKRFYWTTFTEKKVHSVSISGEGYTTFEVQNARLIHDVKDMTENCLSVETECAVNNGGCPHMCLPKTDGGVSCF
uniref:Vitellogenin receptor n=1 Tax=Plectus sambesii TaxID=2011161 RepID=A0A914VRI8_9BILA